MTIQQYPDVCISNASTHSLMEASVILAQCCKEIGGQSKISEMSELEKRDYYYEVLSKQVSRVWLAYSRNQIVGVIAVKANQVKYVVVLENFRKRGLGKLMIQTATGYLREKEFYSIHTSIDRSNTPAKDFFGALGWQKIGEKTSMSDEGKKCHIQSYGWQIIN